MARLTGESHGLTETVRIEGDINLDAYWRAYNPRDEGDETPEPDNAEKLRFLLRHLGRHINDVTTGYQARTAAEEAARPIREQPTREWERDTSTPPRENGERT